MAPEDDTHAAPDAHDASQSHVALSKHQVTVLASMLVPWLLATGYLRLWQLSDAPHPPGGALQWIDLLKSDVGTGVVVAALALLALAGNRWRLARLVAVCVGLCLFLFFHVCAVYFFTLTGNSIDVFLIVEGVKPYMWSLVVGSTDMMTRAFSIFVPLALAFFIPYTHLRMSRPLTLPTSRRVTGAVVAAALALALAPAPSYTHDLTLQRSVAVYLVAESIAWAVAPEVDDDQVVTQAVAVARVADQKPRNVVLIQYESTPAKSTSLHVPELGNTPFLDGLAARGLDMRRHHAIVPHTSKALVAVHCGIPPNFDVRITEASQVPLPTRCLPELLSEVGYETAYFQSASRMFEMGFGLIENLGFEDAYFLEEMSTEGFRSVNYLGYEDAVMLAPIEAWLEKVDDSKPFMMSVMTLAPHHDYTMSDWPGAPDSERARHLALVRTVDDFARDVHALLERRGLLEDTVFVLTSDHGEAFGEHGAYFHDMVMHQEALHIPLVITSPGLEPGRVDALTHQADLLPTLVALSGHTFTQGPHPLGGVDVRTLAVTPPRAHVSSCWLADRCAARIEWPLKYIHYYGQRQDEVFDLEADPREREDLFDKHRDDVPRWRELLLDRITRVRGAYGLTR